jgi:Holliday junction resolvasome RuvABC DNA-binding subunit
MKITKRQLKRIIKEEKRKLQEVYPIGGGETSESWETFKDAVYEVAAGFIDAGMEAVDVMGAMQDEIESIINEMETTWDDADDLDDDGYAPPRPSGVRGDIMTGEDR